MSDKWNEIGKKLSNAAASGCNAAVKKIVTNFKGNHLVLDWKDERVDCVS